METSEKHKKGKQCPAIASPFLLPVTRERLTGHIVKGTSNGLRYLRVGGTR
jgi:hypothetical protein